MAAASARVVPIYIDCTDRNNPPEIKGKYNVGGLPTVVWTDPEGKKLKEVVGFTESSNFMNGIEAAAKKLPGRASMWHNTQKSAGVAVKGSKKLSAVAVYIAKEGADPLKVTAALHKNLGDRKSKLAWTWETGTAKVLEARGLDSAPAVVLYGVGEKEGDLDLLGKVTVKEGDDPKLMNDAIDEILKGAKK